MKHSLGCGRGGSSGLATAWQPAKLNAVGITFEHDGMKFSADSPEEAAALVRLLRSPEQASRHAESVYGPWDPDTFTSYLRRLGDTQTTTLAYLIIHRKVTDVELRTLLKKDGNQALAGVISGVTRQAEAMGIDPRAIFSVRNWRVAGKRHVEYVATPELLRIAHEMHWPTDPEMFSAIA